MTQPLVNLEGKQIIGVVSGHRQKEVDDFFDSPPQPEKVQVVLPKGKDGHA